MRLARRIGHEGVMLVRDASLPDYQGRRDAVDACLRLLQKLAVDVSASEAGHLALETLEDALGVTRAAVLLFDADGVMRFVASRDLSERYQQHVDGHSPWTPRSRQPEPILVEDVTHDRTLSPYLEVIQREGIAALAFFPLVADRRVVGKMMLYFDAPHVMRRDDVDAAQLIAAILAFALARRRTPVPQPPHTPAAL